MGTLLIVDDESHVRYSLEKYLRSETLNVICAASGKEAIETTRKQRPDVVVLDVRLPDMSGLEVFDRIRRIDPRLPVVIITAHATTEIAIEAMKQGAFEYLPKPVDLHQLREVVGQAVHSSALSRVPAVFNQEGSTETDVDRIVGLSGPMQEVYKKIGRVSPQDVNVLILGESGTGKELVARAIYSHSRRSKRAFLAINCAAIPETLLESELFGHERGSFTGADRRRIGKFEQAHGGTVFLDEIGDMTFATQAKILRLLQDGRFQRVGGNDTIQTDVRVLAATNRNLEGLLKAGTFREDLFYRLNVFAIHLPPLRERMEDLPLLVEYFTRRLSREPGKGQPIVPPESMELLEGYDWPGNIRQLQRRFDTPWFRQREMFLHRSTFRRTCTPGCPCNARWRGRPSDFPVLLRWCASSWTRAKQTSTTTCTLRSTEPFLTRSSATPTAAKHRPPSSWEFRGPRFEPNSPHWDWRRRRDRKKTNPSEPVTPPRGPRETPALFRSTSYRRPSTIREIACSSGRSHRCWHASYQDWLPRLRGASSSSFRSSL